MLRVRVSVVVYVLERGDDYLILLCQLGPILTCHVILNLNFVFCASWQKSMWQLGLVWLWHKCLPLSD